MTAHCEGCSCKVSHTREICWKEDCSYCSLPPRKHGFNHDAWIAKMKKEHDANEPYRKMRDGEI